MSFDCCASAPPSDLDHYGLGTGAPEVIHEAPMAMRFRAKLVDSINLLHVYPTMAEPLKVVAIARCKIRQSYPAVPNRTAGFNKGL